MYRTSRFALVRERSLVGAEDGEQRRRCHHRRRAPLAPIPQLHLRRCAVATYTPSMDGESRLQSPASPSCKRCRCRGIPATVDVTVNLDTQALDPVAGVAFITTEPRLILTNRVEIHHPISHGSSLDRHHHRQGRGAVLMLHQAARLLHQHGTLQPALPWSALQTDGLSVRGRWLPGPRVRPQCVKFRGPAQPQLG